MCVLLEYLCVLLGDVVTVNLYYWINTYIHRQRTYSHTYSFHICIQGSAHTGR